MSWCVNYIERYVSFRWGGGVLFSCLGVLLSPKSFIVINIFKK